MADRRTALALAAGVVTGLVAERRWVHRRLVPPPGRAPLGRRAGEPTVIAGPRDLPIAVESYGPVGGPVAVLVHGWLCTGRVWHAQVEALAGAARLVTLDHPGHGRTPMPADGHLDLDLLGDALARVVEEATPPGPVVLVGHSLGGMTVLNALRRHPGLRARTRGTVLCSTASSALGDRWRPEPGIRSLAAVVRGTGTTERWAGRRGLRRVLDLVDHVAAARSDVASLAVRATGLGPGADPRVTDLVVAMARAAGPAAFLALVPALVTLDEDAALAVLPPSTAVVGTRDRLTPPVLSRRMASLAGGRLGVREVRGAGHLTPLEAAPAVTAAVRHHLGLGGGAAPEAA